MDDKSIVLRSAERIQKERGKPWIQVDSGKDERTVVSSFRVEDELIWLESCLEIRRKDGITS